MTEVSPHSEYEIPNHLLGNPLLLVDIGALHEVSEITTREYNGLKNKGLYFIAQLIALPFNDDGSSLPEIKIKGLHHKSWWDIRCFLRFMELDLGMIHLPEDLMNANRYQKEEIQAKLRGILQIDPDIPVPSVERFRGNSKKRQQHFLYPGCKEHLGCDFKL